MRVHSRLHDLTMLPRCPYCAAAFLPPTDRTDQMQPPMSASHSQSSPQEFDPEVKLDLLVTLKNGRIIYHRDGKDRI